MQVVQLRWIWKDDARMHDVDGEEGRVLQFDRPWGGGVHIFHPCRGSFYFPCAIVKAHEFQHTKILVFVSFFRVRHGVAYHRSQFIASQLLICPVCVFPEIKTNGTCGTS